MVAKRAIKASAFVLGGGAIELELSKHVRKFTMWISGKEQLVFLASSNALEIIPRTLSQNAGLDSVEIIKKLI